MGASYLLAMLVGAEPRGLPGTTTDRVAFQRATEGHPLDDVIVYAHDALGKAATLEVQVKKGITFAPGDKIFRQVVGQIVEASRKPDFLTTRYELGIAISRTSHNIDGAYQDVLTWARQIGDSATFMNRIDRPGSANKRMRSFVETFRAHLKDAGAPHDDETVWQLLRRMDILVFDFTATGSAFEELAKERAARALHPEDTSRAGNFWDELVELAIEIAKAGGDRNRDALKTELAQKKFRLAEDRHNLPALAALAEASRNALADIDDRIAGAVLTRHERVASVHDALDQGRYLEIRGDAGVGKSVVLRHFAEQVSAEARIIALSPSRTVAKGWTVMCSVLNFDGTARELLSDLAASGGALLFIDSLDFYGEDERRTVIDLVREAAKVPGISVIATARRDFGVAEPNWLPPDALDALGRAEPVVIGELSDDETGELRNAAPQLTALLSDTHPARPVARNLFRLSRLANRPSEAPIPHTEVEMAEQWWQSADGKKDHGHRERSRVLMALAEQALSRVEHLSVSGLAAAAVDALVVATETLRDLGNDRVTFRHDVLREWAIANLLFADPALVARLPLDRPAPADLARGVELAARLAIERTGSAEAWRQFLTTLSKEGVNDSWRRAVLLALVRSEVAGEMLSKASSYLLADQGKLLGELIRIVMAVDSEPATKYYAGMGLNPRSIPAGINIPSGPTWLRLIIWLLKLGSNVPPPVIPDVVALYTNWSMVLGGKDPCTPHIVRWFYQWLTEIAKPSDGERPRRPFNGELSGQVGKLAEDLRTSFLLVCNHAPELAVAYLQSLKEHPYTHRVREEILKFRGALAQAAPKELAELTAELLIPKKEEDDEDRRSPFREPFGHANLNFVPASPAQGPFLELLVYAPEHGLPLVRRLVDHAIHFHTGGRDFGENAMTIVFSDGSKVVFPWYRTYSWSRDLGSGPAALASALMALEAWSHSRIEAGEPMDKVIADVIGPPNPPAAYLLVIVDLLLSHWPKSSVAAVPFLACPELLCLDRQRTGADNIEFPDIFGLKGLQKEPVGLASIDSLKARPSRRITLDQLLGYYAQEEFKEQRATLAELLRRAAERLGAPKPESDLGDPEFMVVHALNQINPDNWRKTTVQGADGPIERWEYVSPTAESEHLKPLQDASRERHANANMQQAIRIALNNPARSSQAFAAAAVKWAREVKDKPCENETEQWMREEAVVTAAAIAARDGGPELIAEIGDWIRKTFEQAFKGKTDPVHRFRAGLQFNPIAIAFVGTVLLLRTRFAMEDVRTLLEAAVDDNPAAAQGFVYVAAALASIDERLPRAVLRCAFAACPRPHRDWGVSEENYAARVAARRKEVGSAIGAELAWLNGERDEPGWPPFEREPAHPRHHFGRRWERVGEHEDTKPELYTDHQAAALWLGNAAKIFDVVKRPWLRDVVKAYSAWTSVANGSELDEGEDADRTPHEWNEAYFKLLAHCLPGLTTAQIDEVSLGPFFGLPDDAFLDVMTIFLHSVDAVYFSDLGLQKAQAVHVRTVLASKLMETRQWTWQSRDRSTSISTRLGPAIAVIFFNEYATFVPAKCYLLEKGIDRLGPFLPVLGEVVQRGTFLFVAVTLLNLLEVSPRPEHLPLIVTAGKLWFAAHPDGKEFWIEHSIGRRLCSVIEAIVALDPKAFAQDQTARREIEGLLPGLIRLGVAEAHHLEEALRRNQ
ncbi:MAG TPA: ATP-binding protein [Terriglobia bacterium]|nr:ATP-binding protein [Terriglobia bacterium]